MTDVTLHTKRGTGRLRIINATQAEYAKTHWGKPLCCARRRSQPFEEVALIDGELAQDPRYKRNRLPNIIAALLAIISAREWHLQRR